LLDLEELLMQAWWCGWATSGEGYNSEWMPIMREPELVATQKADVKVLLDSVENGGYSD
jgi:hypothetical protein